MKAKEVIVVIQVVVVMRKNSIVSKLLEEQLVHVIPFVSLKRNLEVLDQLQSEVANSS